MVIVHEIRDEDEDFESQLVRNDGVIDDYTTDDEDFEELEDDYERGNGKLNGPFAFISAIIPAKFRSRLSIWSRRALSASISFAKLTGKAAWIITTSVLLVGLPLLYAYDREKSLVDYEKEQQRFAPPVASQ